MIIILLGLSLEFFPRVPWIFLLEGIPIIILFLKELSQNKRKEIISVCFNYSLYFNLHGVVILQEICLDLKQDAKVLSIGGWTELYD